MFSLDIPTLELYSRVYLVDNKGAILSYIIKFSKKQRLVNKIFIETTNNEPFCRFYYLLEIIKSSSIFTNLIKDTNTNYI